MTDPTIDIQLGKRELLRHAVATLAYRGAKAIRNAPPELADFRVADLSLRFVTASTDGAGA